MTPNKRRSSQAAGHVLGPAVAIGGLSLVLAAGLAALGFDVDTARRVVRVSAGWDTTAADWRVLADAFAAVANEVHA